MSFPSTVPTSRREFLGATAVAVSSAMCSNASQTLAAEEANNSSALYYRSARSLRDMIRAKKVSSAEVVMSFIKRIDLVDPQINAVTYFPKKGAMDEANAADTLIKSGKADWKSKPLLGVPVSIKDMYEIAGMPTTAGARIRKGNISNRDATAVRKLREAGAIIVAMTNTPLNHSALETANNLHGRTNNPYDLERTPGGSSGGEAALIAAGGSPCGLGGDSGGSIRIPSHFCGVAGLAPAWGRVSTAGNVPFIYNAGPFYLRCGPMARKVEDLALVLPIISGHDSRDPFTFPMNLGDPTQVQVDALKVAYCTDSRKVKPSKEIQTTVERAADVLRTHVTVVSREVPPNFDSDDPLEIEGSFTILGMSMEDQLEELRELGEEDDSLRQESIRRGAEWLKNRDSEKLKQHAAKLPEMRLQMNRLMAEFDVLLCPVAADLAYRHGESWERIFQTGMFWVNSFNLYGNLPTGVVRCGTSADGLPIGVQVVGASYREDIVLAVMQLLETKLEGWKPPPEEKLVG